MSSKHLVLQHDSIGGELHEISSAPLSNCCSKTWRKWKCFSTNVYMLLSLWPQPLLSHRLRRICFEWWADCRSEDPYFFPLCNIFCLILAIHVLQWQLGTGCIFHSQIGGYSADLPTFYKKKMSNLFVGCINCMLPEKQSWEDQWNFCRGRQLSHCVHMDARRCGNQLIMAWCVFW